MHRVAVISPSAHRTGHFSRYTQRFVQALLAEGHHVTLVTAKGLRGDWHKRLGIEVFGPEQLGLFTSDGTEREAVLLARAYAEMHPVDAVHFLDVYDLVAFLTSLAKVQLQVPCIAITVHGYSHVLGNESRLPVVQQVKLRLRELVAAVLIRFTPAFSWLAIGRRAHSYYSRFIGSLPGHAIPVGVDDSAVPVPIDEARHRLGLHPAPYPYFAFTGKLKSHKGLPLLIEALRGLRPDFGVLFAVSYAEGEPLCLTRELEAIGWAEHCHVWDAGELDDDSFLADIYSAADAVLVPYAKFFHQESVVISEAIAYSKPVLASDHGWVGEVTSSHGIGLTFDASAGRHLAETIQQFRSLSPKDLASMQQSISRLREAWGFQRVGKLASEIYRTGRSSFEFQF